MLSIFPQIKVLGKDNGLTVNQFIRIMRAEWRHGNWTDMDRVDMILDFVSPKVRHELKIHGVCSNSENMLEALYGIQAYESKLPAHMDTIFTKKNCEGDAVYENSIMSEMNLKGCENEQKITEKLNEQLIAENSKYVIEIGIQTDMANITNAHCDSDLEIKKLREIINDLKRQMLELRQNFSSRKTQCYRNKHHKNANEVLHKNIEAENYSVQEFNSKPALND